MKLELEGEELSRLQAREVWLRNVPRPACYCPYDSPCQFAIVFVNPLLSLSSSDILLNFFPKLSTCMLNKVIWIIGYRNDESRFVFSSMESALRSPWPTSTSRSSPSRSPPRLEKLKCKSQTFFLQRLTPMSSSICLDNFSTRILSQRWNYKRAVIFFFRIHKKKYLIVWPRWRWPLARSYGSSWLMKFFDRFYFTNKILRKVESCRNFLEKQKPWIKGIVHNLFSFLKSHILGYDGVWYSSFWSEGSGNHLSWQNLA